MFVYIFVSYVLLINNLYSMTKVKKVQEVQNSKNGNNEKSQELLKKDDIFEPMKIKPKESVKKGVESITKNLIADFRPSAEERIKNAGKFQILTDKFKHLKDKKEELEKFKISSDGTKEKIFFENAEGYKLEVSNSNVIDKMLNLAETTLDNILLDTQKQVEEFVI